jgi:hypothetical protein
MCKKISSECLLTNILFYQNKPIEISFLKKIRNVVYKLLIDECFYIDVSSDSIYFTIESNPSFFKLNDEHLISRAQDFDKYYTQQYLDEFVNSDLPKKFQDVIKTSIRENS